MILVTGATGLVGGHLLWHLLQSNDTVVATKRANSNLDPLKKIFSFYSQSGVSVFNKIQWRIADVNDELSICNAMIDIDVVYHCAAIVSLSNGLDDIISTNVKGTANIVNAAIDAGVQKFCFVSSIAACGHETDQRLITEISPIGDVSLRSAYAQSKYYSEQEVWKGIDKGLNAVIVNPGVILGYSGTDRGSSELFATVRKGLPFYTLGGSGYVAVDDVVKVMIELINSNVVGERFILVAENCSNKEVIGWMAEGYGKRKPQILIGRKLLVTIGFFAELYQKISGRSAKFDRSLARSASNRSWYSNKKIKNQTSYQFKTIENCIKQVCVFENSARK